MTFLDMGAFMFPFSVALGTVVGLLMVLKFFYVQPFADIWDVTYNPRTGDDGCKLFGSLNAVLAVLQCLWLLALGGTMDEPFKGASFFISIGTGIHFAALVWCLLDKKLVPFMKKKHMNIVKKKGGV